MKIFHSFNSIREFAAKRDNILFIASLFFLSSVVLLYRYYLVPPLFEIEPDSYYHAMMGYLFPDVWNLKTFYWTSFSIWENCYYDKEWLFHFLLNILYRWKSFFFTSDTPPFHYYFFVFNCAFLICLGVCLRYFSRKFTFIWLFFCLFISPLFFYRLLMVRPQILSIILFLAVSMLCFTGEIDLKKKILVFLFGILYVYSYSHPHFILIPPAIRLFWDFMLSKKFKTGLVFSAAGGFLTGMLLHPQFPNTFKIWWIQCVHVPNSIIFGLKTYGIGEELRSPPKALLADESILYIIFLAGIFIFFRSRIYRLDKNRLTPLLCFMTAQALMLAGFLFSQRAIEYAVPLSVISSFLIWNHMELSLKPLLKKLLMAALVAACCIIFFRCISKNLRHAGPEHCKSAFYNTSSYMNKNIRPGSIIFNLDWSDFPFLFYPAPQFIYAVGLDPFFGAAKYPDRMAAIEKFRTSKEMILSPEELAKITGARFVFVSRRHAANAKKMLENGFQTSYYSIDGWLFDLAISPKKEIY